MTATTVDLDSRIPNNVGLSDDPKLRRALERWQPDFLEWWHEMGPTDFEPNEVYLRTAVSVEPEGWANYEYVKMPDYRFGIFLNPNEAERIHVGDMTGKPVWNEVPGEFRTQLRRIIVTQADTEPASVEQQRLLGHMAPSLYDMRNLFQVNVEEARHLWAMAYLLHKHFGRDGRDEADALLQRRSGSPDHPRILNAFNQPCNDWLSFFCFTMFMDRDGKFQLAALAESGFDPLARSTQFMLTEEAFHLFTGFTGIARILRRTAELEQEDPNGDVRARGGIDFDTVQRAINYWFSYTLDVFGGEISNNAADYFAMGLKGRYKEGKRYEDHVLRERLYEVPVVEEGRLVMREVPMRNAMNEVLRDDYIADCEKAVIKWNRVIEKAGSSFRLRLPSRRFHRHQGIYAGHHFNPDGVLVSKEEFEQNRERWLITDADAAYLRDIMKPVRERGKFANWIAPPPRGIKGTSLDFEFVKGFSGYVN